jgi:hypothetical protein
MCPSSGETSVFMRHLVLVILYGWLSISGPSLGAKAKFLSFNMTQSRVVTSLITVHNTLRRHVHLPGLLDSPLYRGCGVKEKNLAHILCKCEALTSLRCMYLGSFFMEPEDIKSISVGAIWNFGKATGLLWFDMGHKGPVSIRPIFHSTLIC